MGFVRWALIAVGALVTAVALGAVALLLFVDPNRYRPDIERVVREHTGRKLSVQGPLGLRVFPWLALSVHDARLGNAPGFGPDPFATVQKASIGVRLLPLLRGRLQVSRIAVDGLTVRLVRRGDTNNWRDLSRPEPAAAGRTPPTRPAPGAIVSIGGVQLSDSTFVLTDDTRKSTTEVALKEIRIGSLSTTPFSSSVEAVSIQGTYLNRMDTNVGHETPKPLPFLLRTKAIALDPAARTLAPATIEAKVGELSIIVTLAGAQLSHDASNRVVPAPIEGTIAIPKVSPRDLLQSLAATPPVTRDNSVLSALTLSTRYRLYGARVELSDLDLSLDDTRVQGTATLEDFTREVVSFDLKVSGIDLDRYRSPVVKGPPAGETPVKTAPTPLPLEILRKLDAHGTLHVNTATFAGLVFTDASLPLVAKDGRVELGPTDARLYGGRYNGDMVLDARPAQAQLSLNEHVHDTDVGALVKAAYDSTRLSGLGDANVAVTGEGNTDEALIRSLNGKIDAIVKQGALNGVDIGYELQRAGMLLQRQAPPQRTAPERTLFNTLQASCTLEHGMLRNDDLRIETDFLKVHGSGTLDLATEAIDYRIAASTAASARDAGNGPGALQGVEVPLLVTGTVSRPIVRPDLEALAKGRLGKEVKERAGDLLKKKLQELLGH